MVIFRIIDKCAVIGDLERDLLKVGFNEFYRMFTGKSLILKPHQEFRQGKIKKGNILARCLKLLLRLGYYDIEKEKIPIDGIDLTEYRMDSVKKAISYVPQNIELFSKSISDNIRVSKQNASLDEVKEAVKKEDDHEFIKRLPMQYYTFLEEAGNGLSGGLGKAENTTGQSALKETIST